MAFDAGTAKGTVELDAQRFLASLDRIERSLDAIEGETRQTDKALSGFVGSIVTLDSVLNLAARAFNLVERAIAPFARELALASDEAAEAQTAVQGLVTILSLRGATGIEGVTGAVNELAAELESLGVQSDETTLRVASTLTRFGVGQEDLVEFTEAVSTFAQATGIEASQAAELFGRSLDGTAGRLTEYLPGLRGVTEEQLKSGEAFRIALDSLSGFSEGVALTSEAIEKQLAFALSNLREQLGGEFNPVLDQLRLQLTEVVKELTIFVKENGPLFRDFFVDTAQGALEFGASVAEGFASAVEAGAKFISFVELSLPAIVGTFAEINLQIREAILAFDEATDIGEVNESTIKARENVAAARAEVERLAGAFAEAAAEAAESEQEAQQIADAARLAATGARQLAAGLESARTAASGLDANFDGAAGGARDLSHFAASADEAIKAAVAHAAELAQELEAGEDAAEGISSGLGGGGGGGGGAGGADPFGRRQGPRVQLGAGTGSVFDSLATLDFINNRLRGASEAAGTGGGIEQARAIAEQVRAIAQSQINVAFSEFTDQVLRELGSAGVFDSAERERILNARITEAQRLGILPPRQAPQFGSGVFPR